MSYKEQIMSADKYPSIFSPPNGSYLIILQIFFATRTVLKIGEYILGYFPVLAFPKFKVALNSAYRMFLNF